MRSACFRKPFLYTSLLNVSLLFFFFLFPLLLGFWVFGWGLNRESWVAYRYWQHYYILILVFFSFVVVVLLCVPWTILLFLFELPGSVRSFYIFLRRYGFLVIDWGFKLLSLLYSSYAQKRTNERRRRKEARCNCQKTAMQLKSATTTASWILRIWLGQMFLLSIPPV